MYYQEFIKIYKEGNYNDINFRENEIQKYFVYYQIYNNNNIDNQNIKKNFNNVT